MKRLFIEFTALLLLCGCSSSRHTENALVSNENKTVERIDTIRTHDTLVVNNEARDSIVIQTKGDTVYVEKWKIRYKTRDKIVTQYETKIIHDTIAKIVTEKKESATKTSSLFSKKVEILLAIFVFLIFMYILYKSISYYRKKR